MKLTAAKNLSEKIVAELAPFCMQIEIAGSIRRECAVVNDIDIVLIPKMSMRVIVGRITEKWRQVAGEKGDARNLRFMSPNDFQLDVFLAHGEIKDLVSTTPTNWGAVLLTRTGSKQHNIQICSRAHEKGLRFAPYRGVVKAGRFVSTDGSAGLSDAIIASATEEEIYEALGLKWRDPREREVLKV